MFQHFQDQDGYSFYSATRLYFALKKNYLNQGKTIKGKLIRPIKSCLNYTKALLYPMKVEYQREEYDEVISEEFVSKKFDAFAYKEKLKADVLNSQVSSQQFLSYISDTFKECAEIIDRVLQKSPFNKNTTEYKKLKISIKKLPECKNFKVTSNKSSGIWEFLFVKPLAYLILKQDMPRKVQLVNHSKAMTIPTSYAPMCQ